MAESTPMPSIAALVEATRLPPDTPLTELPGLTWHQTRPLGNAGVRTLGDLAARPDLLKIPGLGPRRLRMVREALIACAARRDDNDRSPATTDRPTGSPGGNANTAV